MRTWIVAFAVPALIGACGGPEAVPPPAAEETGPLYCYQTLAKVSCYRTPVFRDERRLVSYQGPSPDSYPKPPPQPDPKLYAPEPVNFFVKDPEPVPQPAPPRAAAAPERPVSRGQALPPPQRKPTRLAPQEGSGR